MFKNPGCISNPLWIAKAICALKMLLFRKEYNIPEDHLHSLNIFCKFILRVYAKGWYTSRIGVVPLVGSIMLTYMYLKI